MTCRVARLLQDPPRIDLAVCSECGSSDLEVCRTMNIPGPHVCPACTQSLVGCGGSSPAVRGVPLLSDKDRRRRTYALPTLQWTACL